MKLILAVCLCFLVAHSTQLSVFEQFPINMKRNIMTLFTEVQQKMQTGGPLDAVFDLLDDFKKQVSDEQQQHSLLFNKQSGQCEQELAFRKSEVTDGQNAYDAAVAAIQAAETQLANDRASKVTAEADLRATQTDLQNLIEERKAANDLYVSRIEDHNNAIVALDEALQLIDDLLTGKSSFVELAKVTSKMLKQAVKLRHTKLYAPVIAVFAQISQQKVLADSDALNKVTGLLQRLQENLRVSKQQYTDQEQIDQARFDKKKADLEGQIKSLQDEIQRLEDEINDLLAHIAEQTSIRDAAAAKVQRNEQLRKDAENLCQSVEAEYKAQSSKRTEEQGLIEEIRKVVQARYEQISKQVYERGLKSTDQWKKHQNEYEYKQAQQYEHQQGEYNSEGASGANYNRQEHLEGM